MLIAHFSFTYSALVICRCRRLLWPRPRSTQISIEDTPLYHTVSRCVRKAWLTGVDKDTEHSYEHR
ncbi:protein of unknown function [Shewanella benthica]|uniref:Uncharacterized protein n=1 Tax=Shewanella benthica TaxID=43661 RepID=A0A330M650_9GAMM|nr:protein of unknown function [Shewanella benthica]